MPLPEFKRESSPLGVILISLLLILMCAGGLYFQRELTKPLSRKSFETIVQIEPGQSASKVARSLSGQGILKNPNLFIALARLKGTDNRLRAGTYLCKSDMSISQLHNMLLSGKSSEVKIIIPEGWTIWQVAGRLKEKGLIFDEKSFMDLCNDEEFAQSLGVYGQALEGYLYPETYFVLPNTSVDKIIGTLVAKFQNEISPLTQSLNTNNKRNGLTAYEVLILASMLEREARNKEEKPIIASVYLNRLRRKMKLECCATVRYALNKWDAPLTVSDLKTDSPFNTYLHYGLPPAPICSPGKDSILAVLKPAETDYYFYCYKGDGTHHFSRTLAEHNKAVKKYLKKTRK